MKNETRLETTRKKGSVCVQFVQNVGTSERWNINFYFYLLIVTVYVTVKGPSDP